MRPGVLGPQRSRGVRKLNFYHQVQLRRQHLPAAQDAHHGGAQQHVRVAAGGHGAAVVVDVRWPLAKTWTRWTKQAGLGVAGASGLVPSVFLTRKAILMDSGSMKDAPLVSGMRQTLEVVGEKELSELAKYCTSCRAVA